AGARWTAAAGASATRVSATHHGAGELRQADEPSERVDPGRDREGRSESDHHAGIARPACH
ncbi:hypothetical protein ACKXGD_19130, partial [Enterococcus lactis]|uniref:hypothetical protein n=1 Tax=Enterococcus lactis TaxID=357441 RepID=UPI0039081B5A